MSSSGTCQIAAANLPAELRGLHRDMVPLLALDSREDTVSLGTFRQSIGHLLREGDLIVFNDSRMVASSFSAYFRSIDRFGRINAGTTRIGSRFLVEPRPKEVNPLLTPGDEFTLAGSNYTFTLTGRHTRFKRYWWAEGAKEADHLIQEGIHAVPIRYGYIPFDLPLSYYSGPFATVPGSVEYPSASRPFTRVVMESLWGKGIRTATLTLHCNLGSLEPHEFEHSDKLIEEYYSIPAKTLSMIESTKRHGGRIIAAGTTVTRAIESAYTDTGAAVKSGWTDLFIRPGNQVNIVDGLITGIHDEESSHLSMVHAFAGKSLVRSALGISCENGLLQHEFGDSMIVL